MKTMKFAFILTLVVQTAFASAKDQMHLFIDLMESIYQAQYAPKAWKKEFSNWDLKTETDKVRTWIDETENPGINDYRNALSKFIYSMKDYHVSIQYHATEKATLPLMIRSAEERFFIVYIDRQKLSRESFPYEVGTEVVSFNGKELTQVRDGLVAQTNNGNVEETDKALSEIGLTLRSAERGLKVPRGSVMLGLKSKGKVVTHQLFWDYTPEVAHEIELDSVKGLETEKKLNYAQYLDQKTSAIELVSTDSSNNWGLGTKSSMLGSLGEKIWSAPAKDIFDAYICMYEQIF